MARLAALVAGLGVSLAGCAGNPPAPGSPGYARAETRQAVRLALEPEKGGRLTLLLLGAERRLTRLERAHDAGDRAVVLALADAYRIVVEDGVGGRLGEGDAREEGRRDVDEVLTEHLARLAAVREGAAEGMVAAVLEEAAAAARATRDAARARSERQ